MTSRLQRRAVLRGGLAATVIGGVATATATPSLAAEPRPRPGPRQVEEPEIFGTEDWEARAPSGEIVIENHRPTYIVVHHTVEPGNTDDHSQERAFEISRSIQNFHMDSNGWVDSGQQFTISRGGYITEGRHHSLEVLRAGTQHVQGANVGGHNSEVIGIENEGMYSEVDVTDELWESLVDLVSYMAAQYEVPTDNIMGHRDFNSTECPGEVLYGRLPELREEVADRLGSDIGPENRRAQWPLLQPGDRGANVRTAQQLLRANGAKGVETNGVYGPGTQRAVAELAERHGLDKPTCAACAHDERGLLGADIWPLIITGERSAEDWKRMLATQ